MKTSVSLIRKMGEFDVIQRTQDGMFNATELLKQWNKSSGQQKGVHHYFEQSSTKEFITALVEEESKERNTAKTSISAIYTKQRGISGGTWMNPMLFIDFAMWLNPVFKVKVLKFVYDELIRFRNDAGDSYRTMSESVSKLSKKGDIQKNISKIAEAVNWVVMNRHEKMIRNQANEPQMKEYAAIERDIALLINNKFITSYDQLLDYLRNTWNSKYRPISLF